MSPKLITKFGDSPNVSPNLVINWSPNLVIHQIRHQIWWQICHHIWWITKFGDEFVTKFVTKYLGNLYGLWQCLHIEHKSRTTWWDFGGFQICWTPFQFLYSWGFPGKSSPPPSCYSLLQPQDTSKFLGLLSGALFSDQHANNKTYHLLSNLRSNHLTSHIPPT